MRRAGGIFIAAALCFCVAASTATAKTYKPTRLGDPKPGKCKPKDCSLREAVKAAGRNDKIKLGKGTYKLTLEKELKLTSGTDLIGKGHKKTRIDGLDETRILRIDGGNGETMLKRLELRRGHADETLDSTGGAIYATETHVELRSAVVRNSRAEERGGGIEFIGGFLSLDRVTVEGNSAGSLGGGLLLSNEPDVPQTDVVITNSTVANNSAAGAHGGINAYAQYASGELDVIITNSTIAGNEANTGTGGIGAFGPALGVFLEHVSVGYNESNADAVNNELGGGISQAAGAEVNVQSSVITGNTANGSANECLGTFTGEENVLSAVPGCTSFNSGPNVVTGSFIADPLAQNGGPTETMALTTGSPATGYAEEALCPERDQRGENRPDDRDSGAFELDPE